MLVWAVWCYPDTCLELLKVIWSWAVFPDVGVTKGITISAWSRDNSPLTSVPDESAGDPEEHASTVGTAVPSPTRSSQTYIHYVPTSYDPDARDNSRFPAPRGREDRYEWTERARVTSGHGCM